MTRGRPLVRGARVLALAAALSWTASIGLAAPRPQTLLRGRVTRGVLLHGELPAVSPSTLQPWRFSSTAPASPGAAAGARVLDLSSPSMRNAQGKPRVDGPGDTVRFEARVKWHGQGDPPFGVALHTNANNPGAPDAFENYTMRLVGRSGDELRYAVDLPVYSAGTYEAKAVVVKDGGPLSWSPGGNLVFRPYFREHDRISEKLVHVANLGAGQSGTFEDMIGNESVPNPRGKYTVSWMRAQGVTAVRLLPFKTHRDSPYSATSFLDVCVEHSQPARAIRDQIHALRRQPLDERAQVRVAELEGAMYRAAVKSLRTFIDAAHKKGIRVFVDYVANHTGPDVRLLDLFFADSAGRPMDIFDLGKTAASFEVRAGDPSQLATDASHLGALYQRMEETARRGQPLSLQKIAPHLYGKWGDTRGARNEEEIADGGWFEWKKPGTWQLNHGCQRYGFTWCDKPESAQTLTARRYVLRDLAFLVLLGVDGLRIDHLTGMPKAFMDRDLNLLQGVANKYRPGVQLFYNGEDFHRHALTEPRTDALERGGFRALLGAQGPEQFRAAIDAPWRQCSMLDVGNHDEGGAIRKFGGNTLALARILALNSALGGPDGSKMLDEFAEDRPVDHRGSQHKPWGLFHTTNEMRWVAQVAGQAGRAKRALPALWERQHDWMTQTSGAWHPQVLVAARYRDHNDGELALVASNFHGIEGQAGTFRLSEGARQRIDDRALYQAYNQMEDGSRPLWGAPVPGWRLKRDGVYLQLRANETQILDLRPLRSSSPAPRRANELFTIGYALEFD